MRLLCHRAFVVFAFAIVGECGYAQDSEVALVVEPWLVHSETNGVSMLDGQTTYRISLSGLSPEDKVTAVYGIEERPLELHSTAEVFQSPFNLSWSAAGINPAFLGAFPELEYDSYATIGIDGPASFSEIPGIVDPSIVESPEAPIQSFFTTSGVTDLVVNSSAGSSVYVLPNASNGHPDNEGRVLLFQLTTSGTLSGTIPVQVLLNGNGEQARFWQFTFSDVGSFSGEAACVNDSDGDGVCDEQEISGCDDLEACNFESLATDSDGSCEYPEEGKDCDGNCVVDLDGDGVCENLEDWASSLRLRVEPWKNHDSSLVEIQGQTTYRIYLSELQPNDFVSALFGIEEEPLAILAPQGIYNSVWNAGPTAAGLTTPILTISPESEFDSFVTIGLAQSAGQLGSGYSDPELLESDDSIDHFFTNPGSVELVVESSIGSSLYLLNGAMNGVGGGSGEVLLFQLTTAGEISGRIPVQIFFEGNGALAAARVFEFEGTGTFVGQSSCAYLPGSECDLTIYGCTNPSACNYDPDAQVDDESCNQPDNCGICGGDGTSCLGCMDPDACNYDSSASIDDGSCTTFDIIGECGGQCQFDNNQNGICDTEELGSFGFCGEGTIWNEELQQCVWEVPLFVPGPNGTPILNVCYFDFDQSGIIGLSDLLDMLTAYNRACDP